MAGHSKFKKIKHKKEAADDKRGKEHARVAREIQVAAKLGGPDPNFNARLRMAILTAKKMNFARAKIEENIKLGTNPNAGVAIEEARFEGFGPAGVAVMVEAVVATKKMTIEKSVIRKVFTKYGGTLGEEGCVSYLFQRLGMITYPGDVREEEDMFMLAVDKGADDCQKVVDEYEILCSFERLNAVKEEMEKTLGEPSSAKLIWKPNNTVLLDHKKTKSVLSFLDDLEAVDTVQEVWSNLEIPDDYNDDG